ncbi:uncharacterized protein LOC112466440 [Temnothorax curvispinosus]|uniref:Uncharacterized protein LOC112466440 n=1 Tax=Temnothorax curvispinosus TaxID=300111 RepID=A0A6J1R6L8_9HYME|nr:uncharacterized protein LOC112466440 [Temnothorax curvispinosus]
MNKNISARQFTCGYCNWVLKENQISSHSCLNMIDRNKQVLVADDNRHIYIQDIQYCVNENDEEGSIERIENEIEETDSNTSYLKNKQEIDEELIKTVQKHPPLYDYRIPLKERGQQKADLWRKISEDLKGIYTPTEAEKRWIYLKDRYRKSFNNYKKILKESQKSGAAGIPKNQPFKPSFKHHHLMSFLNDIFEHRSSISSIRMGKKPQPSTSNAVENENSLDEAIFVNTIDEESNEIPSPTVSCSNTSTLPKKKKRSSGNSDEFDETLIEMLKKPSEPDPVNCFAMRLAEGMRRLPYKERSKLELEFLTKLMEVEERLGLE